jgi:hypothetical protein
MVDLVVRLTTGHLYVAERLAVSGEKNNNGP